MKKILILGAGLSATTLIKYLLDHSEANDWNISIGDKDIAIAQKKINGHARAEAFAFDANDAELLKSRVQAADVVISMLPAFMHHKVARVCVDFGVHMVTASYVSKEVKALNEEAKAKGVALLNELGVDPGIDHMSAMKVIDEIRANGGELMAFKSCTGGLIAPQYDTNIWNYKFTWNPRNVVLAGQGVSQFIRDGRYKYIPYHKLFDRVQRTTVLDYGDFEVYPNRDSLSYRETYGLQDIPTIYRGTMRRPGYCEAWNVFVQLGVTDDTYILEGTEDMTYRQFINSYLRFDPEKPVEDKLIEYLKLDPEGDIMKKLKWLGIFDDRKIGLKDATPAQIMQKLLEEKWALDEGDKDMIAMQHEFVYELNGEKKEVTSSMVVLGEDKENTAMSMTVGLPVAIATRLLLNGTINVTGVHVPVKPELYEPILEELATYGIRFVEVENNCQD